MKKTLQQHLDPNDGPKKILSLDGGGVRGALTLGFLKKIETAIREKYNDPSLRLCDYFDLIGGTSTGSIIASALAIGMPLDEIYAKYVELSNRIFPKKSKVSLYSSLLFKGAKFNHLPLEAALKETFKEIKMLDSDLLTGLCIVTKRIDTNSTWPLTNHPKAKYASVNNFLIRDVIRASTAAPSYFKPHLIDVGNGEWGAFVDGGVSMSNNPTLQLFLKATLKGYPFNWRIGKDNLKIVSIGTGGYNMKENPHEIEDFGALKWGINIPNYFMDDATNLVQVLMQYLSSSPKPVVIDREVGDLSGDLLHGVEAFDYMRYNVALEANTLKTLGIPGDFTIEGLKDLREMSNAHNVELLNKIGAAAAEKYVQSIHL